MSIEKFPQYSHFKVADTSELVLAGTFSLESPVQIRQVLTHIYKHGAHGGSESVVAKIFLDSGLTVLLDTSDPVLFSDIEMGDHWRGQVPFNFPNKKFMDSSKSYYIAFEISNYTRSGNDFYISFLVDTTDQIYTAAGSAPIYCALVGYQSRDEEL